MLSTVEPKKSDKPVGIISLCHRLPPDFETTREIFQREKICNSEIVSKQLGIDQIRVYKENCKTNLVVAAAKECLQKSGISALDLGAIIDFSVMPEEYVVPSWCISNPIQHELGAANAFNIGFGGNGTTNLLVALQFACAFIKTRQIDAAMLVAADIAIRGNRVIQGNWPLTVLGDGASALIVANKVGLCEILDIELGSDGSRHDILCIRGGGLAFPDREDLYKLQVDANKFDPNQAWNSVKLMSDRVMQRAGLHYSEISHLVFPSISAQDHDLGLEIFGLEGSTDFEMNRLRYGHIQANDIIINLQQLITGWHNGNRKLGIVCSHGWGFSYGAMLVRC